VNRICLPHRKIELVAVYSSSND